MQTTPYDVLGVRPGARGDEIEYAYRGRRSQYHPDRYAQADAETQTWATQKMQELTAAYRSITEGVPFEKAAETRPTANPVQESTKPVADLEKLLRDNASNFLSEKIFLAPNIPPRKLDGVLSSYGYGFEPRDILVVVDNTVFGSAKDGLLVTRDGIRFREHAMREVGDFLFQDIEHLQLDKHTLYVDGRKQCWMNLPDRRHFENLIALLQHHVSGNASAQTSKGHSGVPDPFPIILLRGKVREDAERAFKIEMEGDDLQICKLVSDIDYEIARRFDQLIEGASHKSRSTGRRVDAIAIESALTACLVLIAHGFSKIPKRIRDEMGDELFQMLHLVTTYANAFDESFQAHVGMPLTESEEERLFLISVFAQDDEQWNAQMNAPRAKTVLEALERQGLSSETAEEVLAATSRSFMKWFKQISMIAFN